MALFITEHPLIAHKVTMLRNRQTGNKEFRELVSEIAMLICYEATRELPISYAEVKTPLSTTTGKFIAGKKFALVPILRAGLGMVEGMLGIMPTTKVGHIGIYRDPESFGPVEYYCKLPHDIAERDIFLLDPMLATGVTTEAAIDVLKERGVKVIKLLCIIAAPEGVNRVLDKHPDVDIYAAAYDQKLDSRGYIIPGLGDAGDRLFGTK